MPFDLPQKCRLRRILRGCFQVISGVFAPGGDEEPFDNLGGRSGAHDLLSTAGLRVVWKAGAATCINDEVAKPETDIPKGSYAAGNRVELPAGAAPPFVVFINGVEQAEGSDYEVRDGSIVFARQIIKEKIGTGRWLAMYLGAWGSYRKNETVDLQFVRNGKTELESDLAIESE